MVMAAQQCVSRRVARLGLPRSTDIMQPRTFPPALTTHAPASETDAWDRGAIWLVAEQRFCPDHKWATSADQEAAARQGPRQSTALAAQLGQWVQGKKQGLWSQTGVGSVSSQWCELGQVTLPFESQKVRIVPHKEALNIRVGSAWHIVGAQ